MQIQHQHDLALSSLDDIANYTNIELLKTTKGGKFYFVLNCSDEIGRGCSSTVVKCYPVNVHDNQVIIKYSTPFAAKIITDSQDFSLSEFENTKRYYPQTYLAHNRMNNVVIITQLHPGMSLSHPDVQIKLETLSFSECTELAMLIMMNYNSLHHNTPSTGQAIAIADIKPDNILIDITFNPNINRHQFSVSIIDFGFAQTVDDEDSSVIMERRSGTPTTAPPELLITAAGGMYGAKQDVFMIASLMMIIFRCINPYSKRLASKIWWLVEFEMDGFLRNFILPEYVQDLVPELSAFLKNMCHLVPEVRPGSDESLRFFVSLHQIALLCTNYDCTRQRINAAKQQFHGGVALPKELLSLFSHTANLHLITQNLWRHPILADSNIQMRHLDLEDYPSLLLEIIDQANNQTLIASTLSTCLESNNDFIAFWNDEFTMVQFNKLFKDECLWVNRLKNIRHQAEIFNYPHDMNLTKVKIYAEQHPESLTAKCLKIAQAKLEELQRPIPMLGWF